MWGGGTQKKEKAQEESPGMCALPLGLWNWKKLRGGAAGKAGLGVNTVHSKERMRAQRYKEWLLGHISSNAQ